MDGGHVITGIICFLLVFIIWQIIKKLQRIPRISDLESQFILITGCDSGFGNRIAKTLDKLGCHVIASCLTEAGETELRKSCSEKFKTIHMDVSKPESVRKAYHVVTNCILPSGKGLWGLLNNAGIPCSSGPIDWLTLEEYHKTLGVNLFGLIDVTMTFLPLIKKERGRVVNTGSFAGRLAASLPPYSVSKYGVEAFSDVLRRDMRQFGVSVSIVEPSFFKTDMLRLDVIEQKLRCGYANLPAEIKLQYGNQYLEQLCEDLQTDLKPFITRDLTPVLEAYTHALLGRFQSPRYPVGGGTWILPLLENLPECISDVILTFNQPKIAAAAQE